MRHMIEGYRSHPGEHCGSVAMRSLLEHYCQLELSEDVVFGLGSGVDCLYMVMPGVGAVAFGRSGSMEVDLGSALGVDYRESVEPDDDRAWQVVREEVLAGRPTMLTGDIFYLDYREYKVHFPSHRFVLLGFDDEREEVYIADRIREEPETCSLGALMTSRNPSEGMSTENLWGRFEDTRVRHDLVEASRIAISRCALRMLGEDGVSDGAAVPAESSGFAEAAFANAAHGIEGIERLAEDLPHWPERPGHAGLASYNASAMEKFGNGGGNFRRMYSRFLDWAHALDPERVPAEAGALSMQAADGWTQLAELLWKASEGDDLWAQARTRALSIAQTERQLFESLADGTRAAG